VSLWSSVLAQVAAEVRTRLRSTSTLVALATMLGASYLCIPDPRGRVSSFCWTTAEGVLQAPVYDAAYLSVAGAILAGIFLMIPAFYLVAGSVRRDRDSRVGAVLAATPLSKTAYLAGKVAAGTAYLAVLSSLALPIALLAFLRWGVGPFHAGAFLLPWLLVLPGSAFIAAMAVLFDVTPGLRGRAGLVTWFFAGMMLTMVVPMQLSGGLGPNARRTSGGLAFDPTGNVTLQVLLERAAPPGHKGISSGITIHNRPFPRVPWPGVSIGAGLLLLRLATSLWTAVPLLVAVLLFDRFDPGRATLRYLRHRGDRLRQVSGDPTPGQRPEAAPPPAAPLHIGELPPVTTAPSFAGSVLAEALLLWETSSALKWALLLASLGGAVAPPEVSRGFGAAFLLLVIPVISEAAAREDLAGTRGLVFSQPGVPASPALWKLSAIAVFLLVMAAPLLLRSLASPAGFVALLTGLLFVAAFATGAGVLTGGGKLFSGLGIALWYAAASGLGPADYCGVFGGGLDAGTRLAYLAAGALFVAAALLRERRAMRP